MRLDEAGELTWAVASAPDAIAAVPQMHPQMWRRGNHRDTATALRTLQELGAMTLMSYLCDKLLKIDDEWAVRSEDGYAWWPHDLAQRIETRPVADRTSERRAEELSGHVTNLAPYRAQQCSEFPLVVEAIAPDREREPFLGPTFPVPD